MNCAIEELEDDEWEINQNEEAEDMRKKYIDFIHQDTPLGLVFQPLEFVKHNSPILFEQYFEFENGVKLINPKYSEESKKFMGSSKEITFSGEFKS